MKLKKRIAILLILTMILTAASCRQQEPVPHGSDTPDQTASTEQSPSETVPETTEDAVPDVPDFDDTYVDSLPEHAQDGLTLHAFNWTYRDILINLENIANAGFKNVLTMPVQQPKGGGSAWWAFYQPLSFSIGDQSSLGTKEELEELCSEAEKYGICILADIVVNHLATTDDEGKEADGTPTVSPAVAAYEPVIYANRNEDTDGNGVTFHHNKNAKGSGAETQYYPYGNLPDLNTSNAYVQARVLSLLKECIDAGIDGFRFDAAKHVETSDDPDYPSDFWENTLGEAEKYYHEKTGEKLYAYGEILNSPLGRDLSFYTDRMLITDDGFTASFKNVFAVKDPQKILNAPLKTGDASQLIAWVESHDEFVTTNTHYTNVRIAKYWSVIAAKKGLGGLFLARPTEELTVGQIGSYGFESEYVAVSNRFHNRFYAAESYESVDGTCYINEKIAENDQGVLILNVGDVDPEAVVKVAVPHLSDGCYYDALTGEKVPVSDHTAYVKFEANGMAVITRSKDVHPRLTISDRDCTFVGDKTVKLEAACCEEAYYWFNDDRASRKDIGEKTEVSLKDHVKDGQAVLHVYLKNGLNEFEQAFTYTEVQLIEGKFNVINLDEKYLNGDYELYIWSWSPSVWSRNYEIRDNVLLVDTTGMTGFLVAVFEKGYEIKNVSSWDPGVLKQSADIKGELLKQGYFDLSGF